MGGQALGGPLDEPSEGAPVQPADARDLGETTNADVTRRRLATAIGTSHRMLIYHFGSKEGLLVTVVREVEERQRAALADLDLQGGSLAEIGRRASSTPGWTSPPSSASAATYPLRPPGHG